MTMRLPAMLLFFAGFLSIVGLERLPDPDPSDHGALRILALIALTSAFTLLVWRNASNAAVSWMNTGSILFISACVATARPLNMTPIFYIWPMLLSAYFLTPRRIVLDGAIFVASFAGALLFFAEPSNRAGAYFAVVMIVGAAMFVIVVMRARIHELVSALERSSRTDPLTGCLNRRGFEEHLTMAQAQRRRGGTACALAVIDIDHFKAVNDMHGHPVGDQVLVRIAEALDEALRAGDVLGRIGGEEFAVLLRGCDGSQARMACQKLLEQVRVTQMGIDRRVTVSIGFALALGGGDDLMTDADAALYEAKRGGRDRVVGASDPPMRVAA